VREGVSWNMTWKRRECGGCDVMRRSGRKGEKVLHCRGRGGGRFREEEEIGGVKRAEAGSREVDREPGSQNKSSC
jgi:hypothetical protein